MNIHTSLVLPLRRILPMSVIASLMCFHTLGQSETRGDESPPPRRVMTWIPPYGLDTSSKRLDESFDGIGMKDGITHVGLQFWQPTKAGGLELVKKFKSIDDSTILERRRWAHARKIKVMLCVYNGASGWDWQLARAAFETHRTKFVDALVKETLRLQLDGVDIDLEGKGNQSATKEAFLQFMKELSVRLRAKGKELSVNTFAYKWHAPNRSWWPELFPFVDGLNVMGYAETGAGALGWRSYKSLKASAGKHTAKLLIGMPGNSSKWLDVSVNQHLQWVGEGAAIGLAIWDARLTDPAWRTKETWQAIANIKAGSGQTNGKQN